MCDGLSRLMRRLFLLVLASAALAQNPPTTTILDTVYRGDGLPAGGTLLISWPEFTTAAGQAIAAGTKSVVLGAGGALSVALVSNTSVTPPNTVYTVVYQLDAVHYRSAGRALARVTDPASIAAQQRGIDNGLHGAVRRIKQPSPRTAADCENAALALLADTTTPAWSGEYDGWSDFLPGGSADIFPGDALTVNVASRGAGFEATVREVDIAVRDFAGEHSNYKIKFSNDAAAPLGFELEPGRIKGSLDLIPLSRSQVGTTYLSALTAAQITQVTSTTITVDAGRAPLTGGGIEVRWSDAGWGQGKDRNLVGRFTTQTFTIPRLSRVQSCYLQQYDGSPTPKYSRYTAALHVDYPL